MKLPTSTSTVTKKYHIEVPTHQHQSTAPAVYKVWFGKHYFIWKGKGLLQSASQLAESIERYLRLQKNEPESWIYHVCNHVAKTRCIRATIEVVQSGFVKKGTKGAIDCLSMLREEQRLLDAAGDDKYCLNNNTQAYVSKWMELDAVSDVQKFLTEWEKSRQ